MTPFNPDSWQDVVGLFVIFSLPSLIGLWLAHRAKIAHLETAEAQRKTASVVTELRNDVIVVREQVQNDHPSNLRDDIDRMHSVAEGTRTQVGIVVSQVELMSGGVNSLRQHMLTQGAEIGGIRKDMGGIWDELHAEREARISLERRLAEFIAREHPGAPPL